MFCQDTKVNQKTSLVSTLNMSNKIISAAKYLQQMSVRVSGVNIAADGCYHPHCLKTFVRDTDSAAVEHTHVDLAMIWLAHELRNCAAKGFVLELEDVWSRYKEYAEEAGVEIPVFPQSQSYISRKND